MTFNVLRHQAAGLQILRRGRHLAVIA